MKTRNGFVSNSSSSSFVVVRNGYFEKKYGVRKLVTEKEEKILTKYGFKKVFCYCSDQVDYDLEHILEKGISKVATSMGMNKVDKNRYNLGYSVTCNQDDVIYFLLKNDISFEATCHYGDETVIYRKGEKNFLIVQNYGSQCKGYYDKKSYNEITKYIDRLPSIQKINVRNFIKREEKWMKKFEEEMDKKADEFKLTEVK